ncbi:MAG: hypothetical protein V2A58_07805 [Planctomycetota bacterium]
MIRVVTSLATCAALVCAVPGTRAEEEITISYKDATEFVGQEMTVVGTITGTHLSTSSGNLYLNFGDYKKDVSVKIPKESLAKFPANAETWYKGKKVKATGVITWEKGLLRLTVSDMAVLKVME